MSKMTGMNKLEELAHNDRPFRLKMFVSTAVVSWIMFSNLVVLGDWTQCVVAGSINLPYFLINTLQLVMGIVLPVSLVFGFLVQLYARPLQRAIQRVKDGEELSADQQEHARKRLARIKPFVLFLNIGGSLIALALVFDASFFSSFLGVAVVGLFVAVAGLSAIVQVNIHTVILEKPQRILKVYQLNKEEARKDFFSQYRSTLVAVFLSLFIVFLFGMAFLIAFEKQASYAHLMEETAAGEITLEEAKETYQSRVASNPVIAADPSEVPFPFEEEGSEVAKRMARLFVGLFVMVLILTVFIQFFSAKAQKGQLQLMKDRINSIAQGEADLTQRIVITQYDDVGYLADGFNRFMDNLQDLFIQISQASEQVADSSDTLNEVLGNTAAATEEMVAAMNQITSNTEKHVDTVVETGDKLSGMVDSLDKISESVDTQASFVEQTSSSMSEMASSIKSVTDTTAKANELAGNLKEVSAEGTEAVDNSIEAVKKIEVSSNKVNEIVGNISEIADQTNLLAMNAAIEAAHAGEAGKGFAVVAEEIRSLAINSADSAHDITQHIQETIERVTNGVQLSEGAGEALSRISKDIEETTNLVDEIAGAMQEQNAGANEILNAITSLVEATQEIRSTATDQKSQNRAMRRSIERVVNVFREIEISTQEMSKGNGEIVEGVERLQKVGQDNQEVVQLLGDRLKGFILN